MAKAKKEVGYDLDQTFTGTQNGTAHTTEEGELLSNFMETAINELEAKAEEVKEVVAEVIETVEEKVEDVVEFVEEKVTDAVQTVEEKVEIVVEKVEEIKEEIADDILIAKTKAANLLAWIRRG